MKQRVLLPFGGGLDRGSGAFIVEPGSFTDLRNVHLARGRVRVRRGLTAKGGGIEGATDILAVSPIRGTQRSLIVAYSSVTRQAWVVTAIIDPTTQNVTLTTVPGATLWTLSSQAPFPRVVVADSFGKAFIAHDEANYQYRQPIKVYDQAQAIVSDLTLDGGAVPMPLRGVARHLQYLVGWGYGFDDNGPPSQRNRAECFRFSLPGDPAKWDANWYMLIGQRGEPILGGGSLPAGFLVGKENELHLITGTNPASFDSRVADPFFGMVAAGAGIVVGERFYFWSAEGPRVSTGGESVAIGDHELNLRGALPDAVLAETDYRSCFAVYRPEENEIEWCFPVPGRGVTWGYAIHLDDVEELGQRWTYRPYSQALRCAGMLAGNIAFDAADPLNAPFPVTTSFTFGGGTGANSWWDGVLEWSNNNLATLPAGSVVEVWGSYGQGTSQISAWAKLSEAPASGSTQSANVRIANPSITGVKPRQFPESIAQLDKVISGLATDAALTAVRYRLPDGSYYSSWASSNPLDWPANSRRTALRGLLSDSNRPGLRDVTIDFAPLAPGELVSDSTSVVLRWRNQRPELWGSGAVVEIWGAGADTNLFDEGTSVDPYGMIAVPAGVTFTLLATRTPLADGVMQEHTQSLAGRYKHFLLRPRMGGGFTGAARYLDGALVETYATLAGKPFNLQASAGAVISTATPFPRIVGYEYALGSTTPRAYPVTVTVQVENVANAPAGNWSIEFIAASQKSQGWIVLPDSTTFEVFPFAPTRYPFVAPETHPQWNSWVTAGQRASQQFPDQRPGLLDTINIYPNQSPAPAATYTWSYPFFMGNPILMVRLLYNDAPYEPQRYGDDITRHTWPRVSRLVIPEPGDNP